ncbi:hypothetical protein [Streptomyces sp. NPDC049881]|uniref:hypothetical protein n=1 Tax=Streptomyces sp. NPDC049881 TaxID=3155778 RepID=UPI0034466254
MKDDKNADDAPREQQSHDESGPDAPSDGKDAEDDAHGPDDPLAFTSLPPEMAALLSDGGFTGAGPPFVLATNSVVNTGPVWGDQRLDNEESPRTDPDGVSRPRVDSREGPVTPGEIFDAKAGYVQPDCFAEALAELDTGLLFLVGEPDTGRRTTALNLLERHSESLALRSVDSDRNLSTWTPSHKGTRGYLMDEPVAVEHLRRGDVDRLRQKLEDADARMVVVLNDSPEARRHLRRALRVTLVDHVAPPPRRIFEAHLCEAVPDRAARDRLLSTLDASLLDELLVPGILAAHIVELVTAIVEGTTDPDSLRERLSFLAREEVPALLDRLKSDPDALSFLLSAAVFEGLDHRVVMDESERLLQLADGKLHAVLHGERADDANRPNQEFVFRRSLTEQLRAVGADRRPSEFRSTSRFGYTAEPVVFRRHRRGEAVLRHVWHEYGPLPSLLTKWLAEVGPRTELTAPAGRIMGLAASWGGGRQALEHLRELAASDRWTPRSIAAYALGLAAQDPALTGAVRYRLVGWSLASDWRLRSTVSLACATDFGLSRPDQALTLLAHLPRDEDEAHGATVAFGVRGALVSLFDAGNQGMVVATLLTWLAHRGPRAAAALDVFGHLLRLRMDWFERDLLRTDGFRDEVTGLVHRMLDDDDHFERASEAVIGLCRTATWRLTARPAAELLLSALAREMTHGTLRLFVRIRQNEERQLFGKHIATPTLAAWRDGGSGQRTTETSGRTV